MNGLQLFDFPSPGVVPFPIYGHHAGFGPGSFIGRCAWLQNLAAVPFIKIVQGHPCRDEAEADKIRFNSNVPGAFITGGREPFLDRFVLGHPNGLATDSTPTAAHAANLIRYAKKGLKYAAVDKPLVIRYHTEWIPVRDALRASGTKLWVTYNHSVNPCVHAISTILGDTNPEDIELWTWFNQGWLNTDPKIRQSALRLAHQWCGPLDIKSHAIVLGSNVARSKIKQVDEAKLSTEGKHGRDGLYDTGAATLTLENGVKMHTSFTQASKREDGRDIDNIGLMVRIKSGKPYRWLMWLLEVGTDVIWVSNAEKQPSQYDFSQWTPIVRGAPFFPGATQKMFGKNPGGHAYGWDTMWYYYFHVLAGQILRDLNHPCVEFLPAWCDIPIATGEEEGEMGTAAVEAVVASHRRGKVVTLDDIRNNVIAPDEPLLWDADGKRITASAA